MPKSTTTNGFVPEAKTRALLPASSRVQQIADLLREEIVSGAVQSGDQLKQEQLCEDFGVSPGPVREALRTLENEGLVEHFPNRGVFVADISAADLIGVLLPVRSAIESFALETAVAEGADDLLADLLAVVDEMRVAAKASDLTAVNEIDVRFHETIIRHSESRHALQLWRSVQPRIRAQIYALASRHPDPARDIVAEHEEILESIASGDKERMKRTIVTHVETTPLRLLDVHPEERSK